MAPRECFNVDVERSILEGSVPFLSAPWTKTPAAAGARRDGDPGSGGRL
ncbi:hypothetical protein GCM10009595_18680 [Falsarthrobacter nasiphocae]